MTVDRKTGRRESRRPDVRWMPNTDMEIYTLEGLHHLVEKCYAADNIHSLTARETPSRELRGFLERSARLFKDLGDRIFVALIALGGRPYFGLDNRGAEERPWVEKNSFRSAREHFDHFRIAVKAQNTAVSELRDTLNERQGNDELQLVISKGIRQLARNIEKGYGT